MIKTTLKRLFRNLGFELKRYRIEVSEAARLKHLLSYYNIDLVLDVGANTGQYATFLRELGYLGKIVSFEPLSTAYSQLKAVSSKDALWEVAPRTAIGSENGEITINIAANSQSSSVLPMLDTHIEAAPESAYCGSETVKLSRLDTLAKEYIDNDTSSIFLKIDVQGFEKQVIEGATEILPLIKGIQMELSLVPLYQEQFLFQEMLDFLNNIGYDLHGVVAGFTDPETGRMLQMDGIFFKS